MRANGMRAHGVGAHGVVDTTHTVPMHTYSKRVPTGFKGGGEAGEAGRSKEKQGVGPRTCGKESNRIFRQVKNGGEMH